MFTRRELHGGTYVIGIDAACDGQRTPIDRAVPDAAALVVIGIARQVQLAAQCIRDSLPGWRMGAAKSHGHVDLLRTRRNPDDRSACNRLERFGVDYSPPSGRGHDGRMGIS